MKKILLSSILLLTSHIAFADVNIESAYVRAVPPGQINSAAFMQLKNTGTQEISLIAASGDVAKNVELHTHIQDDGVMKMRQISQINLPAGAPVTLQPGGMHIMLIGLTRNLTAGENIDLALKFSDGTEQTLQIPVKEIMPMGNMMHKHSPQ